MSPTQAGDPPDAGLTVTPGAKCRATRQKVPGVEFAAEAERDRGAPRPTRSEIRVEVTPPSPFRLRTRSSMDGLTRARNGVLHRLLHVDDQPVLVRVAQLSSGNVLFGATHPEAIQRMRRALWVDLDLRSFYAQYRQDPWIGAAVRTDPYLRPAGRPSAFEALTAAVTEQLIEYERALQIQRRIHAYFGRHSPTHQLRDAASATALATAAPARLESFDLTGKRAIALIRVARQVAMGRIDLEDPDPARQHEAWERLRQIPNIGSWTIEMTALTGQGRIDQFPAGDLGFLKLAGQLASGGDPRARAGEAEVRELFARFGEWSGLASAYALRSAGMAKAALLR